MRAVRTTCAYCGVGCGITARVGDGREVEIGGDTAHPANRGGLCSKGTHLGETVGLGGRLLYPMIGDAQADWDEALRLVAAQFRQAIAEHGPDSVAFYVSGQLLTEDYYAANKLMKGFIGSGNIDTNSRLCMASAVAAHNRAFGEDFVPCSYDDLDKADLIVLVGSNTAWCHPVIWQRIEAAREAKGTKLVVIDPRRTETAERADLHIAIKPDGDVALFNAMLLDMHRRGMTDDAFMARHVTTPDRFWDDLSAGETVLPDGFDEFCDLFAAHPRTVTLFSQGANQSACGTDKGNAITNLHLSTGRIGVPGGGPFSITGQPNAMGGREVGGLANQLACHLGFSEQERAAVGTFWNTDTVAQGPGLKAVDLFNAVHDGRIKALWIMATNPAVSLPDAGFVREALQRCPFVVVSDCITDTDTALMADVRLPALAWGEKDGTVTNSERMISRQRALFPAPGEARADWRIIADVAARMGWAEDFAWPNPAAVFREYAAMTAISAERGLKLDLTDRAIMTDVSYEAMEPFRWGAHQPLLEAGFSHPDGKARLISIAPPAPRAFDPAFPLRLNTNRYRDQWHTMTRTGLSPKLSRHRPEPLLDIHPEDAAGAGVNAGGLVRVSTAQGETVLRARITEAQAKGTISAPMHWTDAFGSAGRSNRLTQRRTDPVSGQPAFKDTPAKIAVVLPDWRAFLVTCDEPARPNVLYWAKARQENGWLVELAGMGNVDVETLLPAGQRLEAADMARGMRRIAVVDASGKLLSALYLTRSGTLPAREWIAAQLGLKDGAAQELLAARSATPLPDTGPTVCICHDVGEITIREAIEGGAGTVAAVGQCTKAGTNCGSCRPMIASLTAQFAPTAKEPAE
ncbi:nitrate reductase [Croceicoccus naphthovorans]|uniref:Nitrate reductase n=1 Tax=Croceicoccus naphthovorans TaxID=1348774 RepID=A0A0G3XES6_9SPHN|nr:nitrate reductase [Croceicoccus naphthovorans]AKM08898.1 nitrate reductase [Croceicoccus naphthovorans]MBB3989333.1 assimilatory nitrate reductase catalytic subunit [Croceicoccus naphthovorans]